MAELNRVVPETEKLTVSGDNRIKSLTGIRWLAALSVFVSHVLVGPDVPPLIMNISQKGYFGVTLFFILSGFILTITYFKKFEKMSFSNVYNFFVARFARIYPLYLFCLLASLSLFYVLNRNVPNYFGLHLLAIQAWSGSTEVAFGLNGPGWSIGVEIFLYSMFPILIFLFRGLFDSPLKIGLLISGTTLLMVIIALFFHLYALDSLNSDNAASAHRWLYRMPLMRLGDFVLGICAGALYVLNLRSKFKVRISTSFLVPIALIFSIVAIYFIPTGNAFSWDVGYAIPLVFLLFAISINSKNIFSRWLSSNHMVFLGEISFAFYLSHVIVSQVIDVIARESLNFWAVVAIKFSLTLLASYVLYKLLEVPSRVFIRNRLVWNSKS